MAKKNYPLGIYISTADNREITDPNGRGDREKAYDLGYQDGLAASGSLEGWSNLTAAIQEKAPIDWGKLDGLEAKCVHPQLGTLTYKLVHDHPRKPNKWIGWGNQETENNHWDTIFECAWQGVSGWTLHIKGDIPLRARTADTLEPGTCFHGKYHGYTIKTAQVIINEYGQRLVIDCATPGLGGYGEAEVEILEVYGVGTFQKQEAGE